MLLCIQGLIHAAETRDSQCILHGKIPKQGPDQHRGIHTCTPSPAVPALRRIYLEWNNDMRSTLGLLPHQSVGGPPQPRWMQGGGALTPQTSTCHIHQIPINHNSINIKCNAYASNTNTNTNTKAPDGMPLNNRHGRHPHLDKKWKHMERSGGSFGNPDRIDSIE